MTFSCLCENGACHYCTQALLGLNFEGVSKSGRTGNAVDEEGQEVGILYLWETIIRVKEMEDLDLV